MLSCQEQRLSEELPAGDVPNPAVPALSLGEPSAPRLEAQLQPAGNALRVSWTKQDDGGSPITHYIVSYKAVSIRHMPVEGGVGRWGSPGGGAERGPLCLSPRSSHPTGGPRYACPVAVSSWCCMAWTGTPSTMCTWWRRTGEASRSPPQWLSAPRPPPPLPQVLLAGTASPVSSGARPAGI